MTRQMSDFFRFVLLSFFFLSVAIAAQNITANLSNEDYSRLLLGRYNAMTSVNLLKTNSKPVREKNNMTMLMLEVKKNWDRLTPEAQKVFGIQAGRPTGLSSTYSETTKNYFKFYYTTSGTNAIATTDANSNGVPDYVENMAAAFCKALSFYDSVGYNRPPIAASDNGRFCVYLSNSAAGSNVYGYSQPETVIGDNPSTTTKETSSMTSYMVMRNNYTGFGSTAAELQIAMEVTCAHEFFHAVQFGYETNNMDGWIMEVCSTWAEDMVFSGDDDNWQYLSEIFGTPDVSVDFDDNNDGSKYSGHWYASWIFMRYLTDRFGDNIPKLFFEANISNDTPTALDNVLKTKSFSYTQAIKDYYVAIGLLTSSNSAPMSTYRFNRGNDYRTLTKNSGGNPTGPFVVKYENTLNYSGTKVSYSSSTSGDKRLMRASADFLKITPNANFVVTATPKTTNANFYVRLLKLDSYTNPTVLSVVEPTLSGSTYSITVNDKASYADYILVVYNAKYATASSRDTTSIQYDITVDAAPATNSITISSPKGGESWLINSTQNITWTSNNVTNVKIEYSADNGTTWSTVSASTPAAAGTYAWTVPATAATQSKIKLSDVDGLATAVTSNVFSVLTAIVPKITLTSPIGGESWQANSSHNITWTSTSVSNVLIELTTDNGTTWSTVAASTPAAAGSYSWSVPNTPSVNSKIRVSDASTVSRNSVSASVFTITAPASSQTLLSEDFSKVTSGSIGSAGTTDISTTSLDTYTLTAGWTGLKVYQAGGAVKIGSSSAMGYLVTPSLDLSSSNGAATLKFDVETYGTDAKAVQVFISTDGGTTFTQIGSDISTTAAMVTQTVAITGGNNTTKIKIAAKAASANRFYLDNIIVTTGSVTAVQDSDYGTKLPKGFELSQNYPNPFNPTTTISFAVPQQVFVQLRVFNQLGEEVATLVNGEVGAGYHSVSWNASNQPSGIYFYELRNGNAVSVKKLILMK